MWPTLGRVDFLGRFSPGAAKCWDVSHGLSQTSCLSGGLTLSKIERERSLKIAFEPVLDPALPKACYSLGLNFISQPINSLFLS